MIILAVFGTIVALGWSLLVIGANGMRFSLGGFEGGFSIWVAWIGAAVLWLAWWFS